MTAATQADRAPVDPAFAFRHGVRRDGMPWITVTHPSAPNVVRLSMPNDPEFEKVRVACWDAEEARKGKPWNPAWNQPA